MAGMHRDKCGAAAVAGVMAALAITRVRICSFTLLRAAVFFSFLTHWPSSACRCQICGSNGDGSKQHW